MKSYILWDITPCSLLKVNRRLPPAFTLFSCLAYFLSLKMEGTCYSETSVDFQRTKMGYIPEDITLQKSLVLPEIEPRVSSQLPVTLLTKS
jgi:hypothetical protein